MGIDWRTALERMHHSDVSEAKRWGMSDEMPNLLRDIIAENVTELEAENTRLKADRRTTDGVIRRQRADLRKCWAETARLREALARMTTAAQAVIDYDGDQIKPPYIDLLLALEAEVSRARPTPPLRTEGEG